MFELLPVLDSAAALTLQTALLCGIVVVGGLLALLSLPWTDAEIAEVDDQARAIFRPLLPPATAPDRAVDPVSSSR